MCRAIPAHYLPARVTRDNQQRLVVQLANTTPLPMRNVQLAVEVVAANGARRVIDLRVANLRGKATQLLQVPVKADAVVDARAYVQRANLGR